MSRSTFARQLLAANRSRAPERLDVPVVILCADQDRLVDPSCSKRLAARLKADLRVHPWAGHDIATDDPDWLLQTVL